VSNARRLAEKAPWGFVTAAVGAPPRPNCRRSLAIREFLLGQEALRRFIAREPLRRVHEAVFAVLALESEPVDAQL